VAALNLFACLLGVLFYLAGDPAAALPTHLGTSSPTSKRPGAPTATPSGPSQRPKAPKPKAKQKTKPAEIFVEPPSVVAGLLGALGSDERQLLGARTYAEAELYSQRASRARTEAEALVSRDVVALATARSNEARAVAALGAARSQVRLYTAALYELGLAEYTGQAALGGTDLASEERRIELTQLSDVAAAASGAGLVTARRELAVAAQRVAVDQTLVLAAKRAAARAEVTLVAARAQLARSAKALLVARTWATVPGAAPSQPSRALLALETVPSASHAKRRRLVPVLVAGGLRPAGPSRPAPPARQAGPSWSPASAGGPSILGPSLLNAGEIEGWFASTGAVANTTVPIGTLVKYYLKAGRLTGVRPDIAFAQSVVETGYFSFPSRGQDLASYNNFAGIGACDSCKHGWKFPSAYSGVLTQETLLNQYATPPPLYGPPGGLVAGLGIAGCCRTWMALSGVWASNPNYGYIILSVYKEMVDWALEHELEKTGLLPAWATSPRLLRA